MSEKLTHDVLATMRNLDPRKKFIDDPDWTTERGLALLAEIDRLRAEVERLLAAIRTHRDQRGDDRCWLDDEQLYRTLPEGYTPSARDTAVELARCEQYIRSRHNPATEYQSPQRRIEELEAEVARLHTALNDIASWNQGTVLDELEEPRAAETARVALGGEASQVSPTHLAASALRQHLDPWYRLGLYIGIREVPGEPGELVVYHQHKTPPKVPESFQGFKVTVRHSGKFVLGGEQP